MKSVILDLCKTNPNGWTMEDALAVREDIELVISIRHEATSTDGILREVAGNYTLRNA